MRCCVLSYCHGSREIALRVALSPPLELTSGFWLLRFGGSRRRLCVFVSTFIVGLRAFLALGVLSRGNNPWGHPLYHGGQTKVHLALVHSIDDRPAMFANPRIHPDVLVYLSQLMSQIQNRGGPLSVPEVHAVFMHHVE